METKNIKQYKKNNGEIWLKFHRELMIIDVRIPWNCKDPNKDPHKMLFGSFYLFLLFLSVRPEQRPARFFCSEVVVQIFVFLHWGNFRTNVRTKKNAYTLLWLRNDGGPNVRRLFNQKSIRARNRGF